MALTEAQRYGEKASEAPFLHGVTGSSMLRHLPGAVNGALTRSRVQGGFKAGSRRVQTISGIIAIQEDNEERNGARLG